MSDKRTRQTSFEFADHMSKQRCPSDEFPLLQEPSTSFIKADEFFIAYSENANENIAPSSIFVLYIWVMHDRISDDLT